MHEAMIQELAWRDPGLLHPSWSGLRPIDRRRLSDGRQLDLLLEDEDGRRLVIELKAGRLQRRDVDQVLHYMNVEQRDHPEFRYNAFLIGAESLQPTRLYALEHGVTVLVLNMERMWERAREYELRPAEYTPAPSHRVRDRVPTRGPQTREQVRAYWRQIHPMLPPHRLTQVVDLTVAMLGSDPRFQLSARQSTFTGVFLPDGVKVASIEAHMKAGPHISFWLTDAQADQLVTQGVGKIKGRRGTGKWCHIYKIGDEISVVDAMAWFASGRQASDEAPGMKAGA